VELVNKTTLAVDRSVYLDAFAAERFVFAAKASFTIARSGALRLADDPSPLSPTDAFFGEPGASSMRAEAELGPPKPATDCILLGHAVAAGRQTSGLVRFSVDRMTRAAMVFGRRRWTGWGTRVPSEPEPWDRVPLRWEHAFGGIDDTPVEASQHVREGENPIGRGLFAQRSRKDLDVETLPQIEDPQALLTAPGQRPRPVGFGFVARHWQPRLAYAGTYDAAWKRERMPLLPKDFDPRYHQAAPAPLIVRRLKGGELVRAEGVSAAGPIAFALPSTRVRVTITLANREESTDLSLDTLLVDADAMRVTLLLKGEVRIHGELDDVEETRFEGEVTT
jgi:hypothetical protein